MMDYIVLHKEGRDFSHFLNDPNIKKTIKTKLAFADYLIAGIEDSKLMSYIMLKYSEEIVEMSRLIPDISPIPGKDYLPKRNPKT